MFRSRQTPLSRSSQCVASQAPARSGGAHQAKPASTMAEARPAIISTSPDAMKSMEIDIGGPVMPRSKSRAIVRSFVSFGFSRCPIPGGRTHAMVSLS